VFEPLLQLGNIVGEMTNAATQLEDRLLVFAVQAAEAGNFRINARLDNAILESKATIRRNGRKG